MPQSIIDSLRDPAWQFVGALLTFLGLGVALWVFWMQGQVRELTFGLVSSRRPLAIADELSSRVTVQLDGKSVKNLHLLVFGLKNTGRRAISPNDFERQLTISFPEGQVVSAEISSQIPENLGGELSISETEIRLRPLLLNSDDQLLVQVLLSSTKPSWVTDVRVIDIKRLNS